jgi:hypothetical protein
MLKNAATRIAAASDFDLFINIPLGKRHASNPRFAGTHGEETVIR